MHKRVLPILLLLSLLLAMPVYGVDSGAGTMLYSTRTIIAPGLETVSRVYAGSDGSMQAGYSLELAQSSDVYPIVMACDTMYGGMTMDAAVAYVEATGRNVVGAVNTAYFTSPGVPIGIVVEDGRLRSSADGLNAFAILSNGSYYAVREPHVRFQLDGESWEESVELQYLNKSIETDAIHIYTADFSTVSTRVTDEVWVVRMRITEGELTLSGRVTLEVTEVLETAGEVPIGEETMILTARKDGSNGDFYTRFQPGEIFTLETVCEDEQLKNARYITGCGDILAENGTLTDESQWSPFVAGSHPRTLVGWRSDGTLVMYVADGRSPGYADGLTQRMAAEEMLRQACLFVVCMDGGGSSVIGVRTPGEYTVQTLNRPSAGAQRQCAAYLMLVTDAVSDGQVRYWHLRENGHMVLPGQRLHLTAFGTDGGLYPASGDPSRLLWSADGVLFSDGVYTAPEQSGLHKITVWGGGASGTGNIRVITRPTYLNITRADGKALTDLVVENGDQLRLRITANHYGVPITANETCVSYETSVPLGAADENGIFTVQALPYTEGTLTLRVGGITEEIRLKVVPSRTDISAYRYKTALDDYLGA